MAKHDDKTHVQSLVFSREDFTAQTARAWSKKHGFRFGFVDAKPHVLRIRQIDPKRFVQGSFRTIELRPGVDAVIGHLK